MTTPKRVAARDRKIVAMVLVVLALAMIAGGYLYYLQEVREIRAAAYQKLAAIGKLKAKEIEQWRAERQEDAQRLSHDALMRKAVVDFLSHPDDAALRSELRAHLKVEQEVGRDADAMLVAPDGTCLLAAGSDSNSIQPALQRAVAAALSSPAPVISDFYRDDQGKVCIDAVAAVRNDDGQPLAVVVLRRSPSEYLYPLIQSWPTTTPSAETVLYQQEGTEVVVLNALHHATNIALNLRFPLTRTNLPAVQGALGRQGMFQGEDYRGVPVLSDISRISSSSWILIAKMDWAEATYEEFYRGTEVAFIVGLFFLLGLTAWVHHQRLTRVYLNFSDIEQRKLAEQERYRTTLYSIGDGVITTDTAGRVLEMNPVAEQLTGWSQREAGGKRLVEIFRVINETSREPVSNPADEVLRNGEIFGLPDRALLIAHDGTERSISDSAAPICNVDGSINGVVLVFSDQTRQLAAQRTLRESDDRLRIVTENSRVGLVMVNRERRYIYANTTYNEILGLPPSDIKGKYVADVLAPIYEAQIRPRLDRAFTGERVVFELQMPGTDGNRFYLARYEPLKEGDSISSVVVVITDITERKQAEVELKERLALREHLAAIAATVPGVIYSFLLRQDGSTCFPYVSAALEKLFGVEAKDLAEDVSAIFSKIHPDDIGRVQASIAESGRTLSTWWDEFRFIHKDKGEIWISGRSLPQKQVDGSILWQGFCMEVTERRQAEAALFESEAEFRAVFELAAVGMAQVGLDGRWLLVNQQLCEILGYSREELLGKTFQDFTYPEDLDADLALVRRLLAGELLTFSMEKRYVRKNGSLVTVNLTVALVNDASGKPDYFISVIEDISERKKSENALLVSEEQFRTMFELASIGMAQADPKTGQLLRVNQKMLKITGYSSDELLGKTFSEITHPDDRQKDWEEFQRVVRGETGEYQLEKRYLHKEGHITWANVNVTVIRNAAGQPIRSMATIDDITVRKQAEAALQHSERKLLEAQRLAKLGNWEWNTATDCHTWSPEIFRIYGRDPELGPAGVPEVQKYFTPESWARLSAQVESALVNGNSYECDAEVVRPDSHPRWITARGEIVRDSSAKITGLRGTVQDITERKQAEEKLRESQALYHSFIEQLPNAVFRKDSAGRYVMVNAEFCRLKGMKAEEFLGRTPVEAACSESAKHDARGQATKYAQQGNTVHDQIMRTGEIVVMDEEYPGVDGGKQFMHVIRMPVFGPTKTIIGTQGIVFDITERVRAEEAHARLAKAVEQAAESIMITDPDGIIVYTNPAFETISGFTNEEAVGQNSHLLKSGKQDAEFYRRMWAVLRNGEVWSGRFINKRKDGALYEEEATISPIRNAGGTIINYVAVKRDVTREVRLEEQFRQSQKMEAFGQLAGGVAHDFNNILAVIQMQAGLLRSDRDIPPTQMDSAAEIETACQRAASLTRQLLLFSRQQTLQPRDLDLNEAVANMTKMLSRIVGEDIIMEIKYAGGPQFIHADPGMVDQVLLNLAVNSRDAMHGGGQLTIETLRMDFDESAASKLPQGWPGAFVCLSVSDTGCGISPAIQSRIFEPFFTTKGVGKGTGLGLATVFGIVQQHKGWIDVHSEVGRGTTFRIFLPCLDKATAKKSKAPVMASVRGGDETILLVEDDDCLRNSVHQALSRLGYDVIVAGHGIEALRIWKEDHERISLVLTDLIMPEGMNGREMTEKFLQENPKLKVIYTSGYSADVVDKDFPLNEGVNFLSKPFEAHKLAKTIRDCLDRN